MDFGESSFQVASWDAVQDIYIFITDIHLFKTITCKTSLRISI